MLLALNIDEKLDLEDLVTRHAVTESHRDGDQGDHAEVGQLAMGGDFLETYLEDQKRHDARQRAPGQDPDPLTKQWIAVTEIAMQQGGQSGHVVETENHPGHGVDT